MRSILQMILKNFKKAIVIFLIFLIFSPTFAEEKIDIWKNNKKEKASETKQLNQPKTESKIKSPQTLSINTNISIQEGEINKLDETKVFGVYDPSDFNFNLNMWSTTKSEDVKASLSRIKKIKLSKTSNEILENILLSISYPPNGMTEKEFVELKINWIIENERTDLIEKFLKQNKDFDGKKRAIQYLVDHNISKANIKKGCEKIKFIDSQIKDSYLEKFKIYCLVFNNKKSEARLLLDLLREQNLSDKFFDDKINFLLGITNKTSQKINEKNLLYFYFSSITIKDFNYEPSPKTKDEIWKYLNSSNLIKLDINNKEKLKNLELAASEERIDKKIIFNFYKQIPFNFNTLLNAKNIYQTLEDSDSRALIYQKYLLAENVSSKVEYLFLLDELFKKANLQSLYTNFLSEKLNEIGLENIPENYKEIAKSKILTRAELQLGKVKYNDKILHQSKVLKFYLENENPKKIQKDVDKILKKIIKNKKYFISAKDVALIESLVKDGFKLPSNFDYKEISQKYEVPKNLIQLIKNEQNAFLALKIVEIIGEDEPHQLDPETIYFITSLLNDMDLINIRNKVLISALPLRV